jgi:hypothetical protein
VTVAKRKFFAGLCGGRISRADVEARTPRRHHTQHDER